MKSRIEPEYILQNYIAMHSINCIYSTHAHKYLPITKSQSDLENHWGKKVFLFEDPPSGISWKEMIISPRGPRPTQTWWDGRPAQILTHRNGHKITSSAFQMAHKPTECATSSIYLVCQMSQVQLFTEHLAIRRFLQSGSSTCWLFEPRNFCPRQEETSLLQQLWFWIKMELTKCL